MSAEITDAERVVLRAAHRYHCRDTGCFDGDDIAEPEILAATRAYGAAERMAGIAAADEAWRRLPEALACVHKEAKHERG